MREWLHHFAVCVPEVDYAAPTVLANRLARTDCVRSSCVCYEVLPRVEIKCSQDTPLSAV